MMQIFHWEWGWSALALAGAFLIITVGMAVILKFRIAQPFFPATLAEFQKDREWLKHISKSSK
jgi:Putative Actinobacterial Holin-X, holin superfamily III